MALAQLALPGAAPSAPAGAPAGEGASAKPKKAHTSKTGAATASAKPAKLAAPGADTIVGRSLMLNGQSGLIAISGSGDALHIDKLRLPGEGVSDSSQRCVVDIVGEKPIEAKSADRPDGLERYEADVSACPFAFDVLNGAVLIPSQITACVFKAADCQTSPGGLWGPDGASLDNDAAAIAKLRSEAEKAMGKAVETLQILARDNAEAADLAHDQNGFAGVRDDACRAYVKERTIGFCAASLTEARAALLNARLAEFAAAGEAAKAEASSKSSGRKGKDAARKPKKTKSAPADASEAPAQ